MTFLTKEPDTIEWIQSFDDNMIFWDVGANIGIYSCFAAKEKRAKTYAFEPSMFNLKILSQNIFHNNLSKDVVIIPISLNEVSKIDDFNMSNTIAGGALSSFSHRISEDGKTFQPVFTYKTLGMSGNDLVQKLKIDKPNYIKIDVDGIEHLILEGGLKFLKKDEIRSLSIEINENFVEQCEKVLSIMKETDFLLKSKKHAEEFDKSIKFSKVYNYLFEKK